MILEADATRDDITWAQAMLICAAVGAVLDDGYICVLPHVRFAMRY